MSIRHAKIVQVRTDLDARCSVDNDCAAGRRERASSLGRLCRFGHCGLPAVVKHCHGRLARATGGDFALTGPKNN